jgi:hypothetical protein
MLISTSGRLKLDPCFSLCININAKWIKDINLRPKSLEVLQERIVKILEQIGIGNKFLTRTSRAQQLRERIDKWDCIKLKSFCTAKEIVTNIQNVGNYLPGMYLTTD